ncbi:MAG: monovalent cation/H(+) antiporter subunit G [Pseudomonadota bacterium]
MSGALIYLGTGLIAVGALFLVLAAVALWRLPDIYTRLHALTKADTAGLALVALGAGLVEQDLRVAVTLGAIVILVAISGATAGHLIARAHLTSEQERR